MEIVISYRAIPGRDGWATGDSVYRALQTLGYTCYRYAKYYKQEKWAYREIPENPCYLLLYLEMNDSDEQYVELLENSKSLKCFWDFDTAMHLEFTRFLAQKFDYNFLANPTFLRSVDRATYLPYAVDDYLFKPNLTQEEKEGVAILGNKFMSRLKFAGSVDIDVIDGKFNNDYVHAISKLKIHVHNYDSGGDGLLVSRIWETLACRTLLLTQKNSTLEKHFEPEKHYVEYNDPLECKYKIKCLLEDNNRRERIESNGYVEAIMNHTYINRVQDIMKRVS